ncbi:hypothetical protein ASO17_27300 [Salmonella enterica subsp. enterica serovar Infantis]|nr:hypothetical protein ASO17_27300 [Salmonella enterica subsp. enterica serovar Infantis]
MAATRMFRKGGKMVRLAKKSGQVGSQSVDKSLPLRAVLISLQHTEVTAKIIQSQGTQTTDQAGIKHIPLKGG